MERVDDLVSLREASKILGYNPDYLSHMIRHGRLPGKRVGRNWFLSKRDIDAYLRGKSPGEEKKKKVKTFSLAFSMVIVCLMITFGCYLVYLSIYYRGFQAAQISTTTSSASDSSISSDTVASQPISSTQTVPNSNF